jgi:hypothetical protein
MEIELLLEKIMNEDVVKNHLVEIYDISIYNEFIAWLDKNRLYLDMSGYPPNPLLILVAEDLLEMYAVNELSWVGYVRNWLLWVDDVEKKERVPQPELPYRKVRLEYYAKK